MVRIEFQNQIGPARSLEQRGNKERRMQSFPEILNKLLDRGFTHARFARCPHLLLSLLSPLLTETVVMGIEHHQAIEVIPEREIGV